MKIEKKCELCSKIFYLIPSRLKFRPGRFCSNKCRNDYFASFPKIKKCLLCGKEFKDRLGGGRKYCASECYYKFLRSEYHGKYQEYKPSKSFGRNTRLHRAVIEKHLGRKLLSCEVVHHINENTNDNRIKNLKVMSQGEHCNIHLNKPRFRNRKQKKEALQFGRKNRLVKIIK